MKQPYAIGIGITVVLACVGAPMYACHHKNTPAAKRARFAAERDVAGCFVEGLEHVDATRSISEHCPDALDVVFDDDRATTWRDALESLHAAEAELRTLGDDRRRAAVAAIQQAQAKAVRAALPDLATLKQDLLVDQATAAAAQVQVAIDAFARGDEPGGIAALRAFDAVIARDLRDE